MKKENVLARVRMESAVRSLKRKFPDFLYLFSQMECRESQYQESQYTFETEKPANRGIFTDGLKIYYHPDFVITCFREQLEGEIMHIVLHGLLGHFLQKDAFPRKEYRDVLMDIQVNYFMERLGIRCNNRWNYVMTRLNSRLKLDFSMGQYYRALQEEQFGRRLLLIASDVRQDDHATWDIGKNQKEADSFWKKAFSILFGEEISQSDLDKDWEGSLEAGNQNIFCKLEKLCQGYNNAKGDTGETYAVRKGKGRNYQDILRELFFVQEVQREEPDSIDPMFYHYGLELYGNTPLLEPSESSEKSMIHMLAIAIDVSGSCAGEKTMGRFWRETYQCISQLRNISGEGEILLLQCDTEIQKEERFSLSEFCESPEKVDVTGMGGTSFEPVFERLRELEKEGNTIDALIYLTDGCGKYPKEGPDYPVYFVMEQCDWCDEEEIPAWIEKIYLEGEK